MRGVFFLLIAIATPAYALDFHEALKLAIEKAPDAKTAELNQKIKTLEAEASLSVLLPQLDFSGSAGLQSSNPRTVSDPWTSNLTLSLTENIYDNGESWTKRRIALTELRRAELELAQSRDSTALAVLQSFYDYSQAERLLAIREEQLGSYRKQFSQVSGQYREGMRTKKDYLRFKSQTQRAEVGVLEARTAMDNAALKILEATGLNGVPPKIVSIAPKVPEGFSVSVPKLEDTRAFAAAREATRVHELSASLVTRNRWPQVLVGGSASYVNSNFMNSGLGFNDTDQSVMGVSATLKWNLWDWGLKSKRAEIAQATRVSEDMQTRKELLQLQTSLGTLSTELERLKASYKLQQELLDMERESQDLLVIEYRAGRLSFIDLSVAQADYVSAQIGLLQTQYAVMSALARSSFYKGDLYEVLARP